MALIAAQAIKSVLNVGSRASALIFTRSYNKAYPDKPPVVWGDTYPKILRYYDWHQGKWQSDPDALLRFYRLHWGGWIRTKAGRNKKLWKKNWERRWWNRQHIFVADRQAEDLEELITPEYKKERFIVDDPYAPYHKRHGLDSLPRGRKQWATSYIQLQYEY